MKTVFGLRLSEDKKHITKFFDSKEFLDIELQRTKDASIFFKNSGLLLIPVVTGADDRSITFTYHMPSKRFADLLLEDLEAARRFGKTLAQVFVLLQTEFQHNQAMALNCNQLEFDGRQAFVHGDFTVHNLLVQDGQLVLLDWNSTSWIKEPFNFASEHWDILWFIQSVYLMPGFGKFSWSQRSVFCRALIDDYLTARNQSTLVELPSYGLAMNAYFYNEIFKPNSKWYQRIKHFPEWLMCRRFWLGVESEWS